MSLCIEREFQFEVGEDVACLDLFLGLLLFKHAGRYLLKVCCAVELICTYRVYVFVSACCGSEAHTRLTFCIVCGFHLFFV